MYLAFLEFCNFRRKGKPEGKGKASELKILEITVVIGIKVDTQCVPKVLAKEL